MFLDSWAHYYETMKSLCSEIYDRQQPLLALRQSPALDRLATFLTDVSTRLAMRGLSATAFILPMARRDIAGYLGLAEETLSRLFSILQKTELLSIRGRSVKIINLNGLKAMSASMH